MRGQTTMFDADVIEDVDAEPDEERKRTQWKIAQFVAKQRMPYEEKVLYAALRAREFYDQTGGQVYVSVGGLDSITLTYFLRDYCKLDIPAASVSTLEDKSIQRVHKSLGVEAIKQLKSKVEVLREFGFPVISKEKARKIEYLQTPDSPDQTFIHAIMTGDMGKQGKFKHSDKIKLPEKWIQLFGGHYNHHRPDLQCQTCPYKVSADCCYWMKEKPGDDWAKEHGLYPYLGLMASEGGQREKGLMKNGCNYFGKTTTRSAPFAIFMRQDILQLSLDLNVPVPEVYGEILRKPDGTLYTTRAQRTGCSMCGFGIHIEKRPHRFDRLREDNPKEWAFWMYDMGWGAMLDYIGVGWEDDPADRELPGQTKLETEEAAT